MNLYDVQVLQLEELTDETTKLLLAAILKHMRLVPIKGIDRNDEPHIRLVSETQASTYEP